MRLHWKFHLFFIVNLLNACYIVDDCTIFVSYMHDSPMEIVVQLNIPAVVLTLQVITPSFW